MPSKLRFVNKLLVFVAAALPCIGALPPAAAQTGIPASDENTGENKATDKTITDKKATRATKNHGPAKSDSTGKKGKEEKRDGKKSAKKESAKKESTRKNGANKKSTEKEAAKARPEHSAKSAGGSASPAATPRKRSEMEREEAALTLVRQHHPALVELLERLKATKQVDYQQAIKELYRDSRRLAALRDRDAGRYSLELRAWQLDSRIRLLAAKLSLEGRAELEVELKACLAERADVRLALKKLERDRAAARAKKLGEEIEKLTAGQAADVNRSFERLLRAARKAAGGRRERVKKAADGAPEEAAGKARAEEAARAASQPPRPQATEATGEPSPP